MLGRRWLVLLFCPVFTAIDWESLTFNYTESRQHCHASQYCVTFEKNGVLSKKSEEHLPPYQLTHRATSNWSTETETGPSALLLRLVEWNKPIPSLRPPFRIVIHVHYCRCTDRQSRMVSLAGEKLCLLKHSEM